MVSMLTMATWRILCSRDAHADHVTCILLMLFLAIKISKAVLSAISATAALFHLLTRSLGSVPRSGVGLRTFGELVLRPVSITAARRVAWRAIVSDS